MTKKMPNLSTRPRGLKKNYDGAILSKAGNVSGDAVRIAIEMDAPDEGDDEDDSIRAARDLISSLSSVDPLHIWWVLENRDVELKAGAELGLDEVKESAEKAVVDIYSYLRGRYIYGIFHDEIWDRRAKDWISTKSLSNAEAHKMPVDLHSDRGDRLDAFKVLREDPNADRVHNERFLPGKGEEIVTADGVNWLNTWVAPAIKPAQGNDKPMLDHILYLCNGNKDHAAMIADWLAYAYQNPGQKINYALLIISAFQGVGKDTLALAMARLLGEANVPFVDDDAIAEGRNEYMKRAQLVVVPEVMCGDRRDVANKMKPIITQPVVRINEKNKKPYFTTNCANVAMFSNHENAAYIEDGDRRHLVIICKSRPMAGDYYRNLYQYIQGADISGFAWFLANRDLSHFNPKGEAPHTEYKDTVRDATKAAWEAFLQDAWESNAAPFDGDVINLREAVSVIGEMKGAPRISTQQIAAFLRNEKIGGGDLGKPRIGKNGSQVRVYAVRKFEDLQSAPTDVIKLCYDGESLAHATTIVNTKELDAEKLRSAPTDAQVRAENAKRYRASATGIAAE